MDRLLEQLITEAARGLEEAEGFGTAEQMDFTGFRGRVERMDDLLIAALFPQHAGQLKSLNIPARLAREQYLHEAMGHLKRCLEAVLPENEAEQERIVHVMLASLPEIRRKLGTDLVAAYQGDPAAKSAEEQNRRPGGQERNEREPVIRPAALNEQQDGSGCCCSHKRGLRDQDGLSGPNVQAAYEKAYSVSFPDLSP